MIDTDQLLTVPELIARAGVPMSTFWKHLDKNLLGLRGALIKAQGRKHLFDAGKCERYIAVQQKLRSESKTTTRRKQAV